MLSASGYLKPCNYYASFNPFTDLTDWAEANGFDWENDLKRKKWYRTCLQQSNMERATEEFSW